MTPKCAKQMLNCSYPTLTSYVKRGHLKAIKNPINGYMIYDDKSVFELYSKLHIQNKSQIIVLHDNKCHNYNITSSQLDQIIGILTSKSNENGDK